MARGGLAIFGGPGPGAGREGGIDRCGQAVRFADITEDILSQKFPQDGEFRPGAFGRVLGPGPGLGLCGGAAAGLGGWLWGLGGQLPLGQAVRMHVVNELHHGLRVVPGALGAGARSTQCWGGLGRGRSWLGARAVLPSFLLLLGRKLGARGGWGTHAPVWGAGCSLGAGRHRSEVLMQFGTTPALRLRCGGPLVLGAIHLGREREREGRVRREARTAPLHSAPCL